MHGLLIINFITPSQYVAIFSKQIYIIELKTIEISCVAGPWTYK